MAWHLMDSEGAVSPDLPRMEFLIGSESDLQTNPPYAPTIGSIAYIADLTKIWMFNENGEWVRIGGDE